jgi:glycosyltransferase involved in cell wall biosynthesis
MKNGKSILFISKSRQSASTRYRASAYFTRYRSIGWHPAHLETGDGVLSRLGILSKAKQADIVVILRKTFPGIFLRLLRKLSKVLVYDFDDAVFCHSSGEFSKTRSARFSRTVALCNQIWAGNRYLQNMAMKSNPNVEWIPTSLDCSRYVAQAAEPRDEFVLVWIGSSSTRKYLEYGIPYLQSIAGQFPRIQLKIIADFDLRIPGLQTVSIPWSEENEAFEISSAQAGIAPMPNDNWTMGKCGLKVLQYMAAGLPVVSSPSGVNAEIVKHGETGFVASTENEWVESVKILMTNPILRKEMGEKGKSIVETKYSLESTFEKIRKNLICLQTPPSNRNRE